MTNCKAGDLAVITHDIESCAGNIGKIVKVSGPAVRNKAGQITWLIRPADGQPYMINDDSGRFLRMMRADDWDIEHPDEWMRPVERDGGTDALEPGGEAAAAGAPDIAPGSVEVQEAAER